jgi:hypothetical protein
LLDKNTGFDDDKKFKQITKNAIKFAKSTNFIMPFSKLKPHYKISIFPLISKTNLPIQRHSFAGINKKTLDEWSLAIEEFSKNKPK